MASDIVNAAHTDLNRHASLIGVIGTLGTADVKGSALTLPIGVNPDNGAMYVDVIDAQFNVGTLSVGTIDKVSEITNGTIRVTDGTVKVTTPGTIASGSINVVAGTIGTVASVGTIHSGTVQITQNVTADDNNSSTANLAPGGTYTGTISSTLGIAGIQVSLKTDQNCTVYVDQSPDVTPNWDVVDQYNYYAGGNFGVTVQAVNSYVRVRVANTGAGTTTYFRLQTALCPIVEAVPRSLSDRGYLKVTQLGDEDAYGFESENTPIGEKRVVTPTRLVGAAFEGTTIDSAFWTIGTANGGTITQGNAQIQLRTGTAANGSATLYSARRARYVSGNSMNYRAIIQQDAGTVNNKRRWGIAYGATMPTITDGAWFEQNGSTSGVVTMRGGTAGTVTTGSFNGNLGATYSWGTAVRTYEIYWTNSKVYFVVGDEILHTLSASATTWSDTMSHYIFMDNVNSGSVTSDVSLYNRVSSIRRLGQLLTQPTSRFQQNVGTVNCKYSPGNVHGVVVSGVQNNAVIQLFDSVGTSSSLLWSTGAMGAITTPFSIDLKGIPFFTALTMSVTAASANALVMYE